MFSAPTRSCRTVATSCLKRRRFQRLGRTLPRSVLVRSWRRTASSWATIGGPWGLCWRGRTRGLPSIVCTSIVALVVLQRLAGVTPMVTCLPLGWLLTIGGGRTAAFLDVGVVGLALCRGILCSLLGFYLIHHIRQSRGEGSYCTTRETNNLSSTITTASSHSSSSISSTIHRHEVHDVRQLQVLQQMSSRLRVQGGALVATDHGLRVLLG